MTTLRMTETLALIHKAGVPAIAEHTGGGVWAIFAGPESGGFYAAVAGPGYDDRGALTFDTSDLYVGTDDQGESDPVVMPSDATAATVAAAIVAQVRIAGESR